jgi:hypothetical protein
MIVLVGGSSSGESRFKCSKRGRSLIKIARLVFGEWTMRESKMGFEQRELKVPRALFSFYISPPEDMRRNMIGQNNMHMS